MKVYTILKNIITKFKSGISQCLADAKDYTDSSLSGMCELYENEWTATSSTGINTTLAETLVLPKGNYIVTYKAPILSSGYVMYLIVNGTMSPKSITLASSYTCVTVHYAFSGDNNTVRLASGQSGTCNFSYLERGGLLATRISDIVGGVILNLLNRRVVIV